MLLPLLLGSLLGLFGAAGAVSNPACSQAPYKELLPLSTFAPALAFCSARFPLAPCTSTHLVYSTVQSTVYSTLTSTKTTITGTSTISDLSTSETTTVYTTTDRVSFDTISTVTIATTITLAARKRDQYNSLEVRALWKTSTTKKTSTTSTTKSISAGNSVPSIWSVLESAAESIVSVACTCIETQPPCKTVTSTTVITLAPTTLPTHATVTTSVKTTTTTTSLTTETITSTYDVPTTSDVVASTTITVSLPFYSQVGGPYDGCEFLDFSQAVQTTFTTEDELDEAIPFCEGVCTADPTCDFVFVQFVNKDDPPLMPFWACFYTEGLTYKYDASTDLDCQSNVPDNAYGLAYAFQNARAPP